MPESPICAARPSGLDAVAHLADLVAGLEVRFHPDLPEHSQRLMATLGVRVLFDERAPSACCFRPSGARGLTRTERRAWGLPVWDAPTRRDER